MASVHAWPRRAAASCWPAVVRRAASVCPSDPATTSRPLRNPPSPQTQSRSCRLTPAQRLKQKRQFDSVYRGAKRSADAHFTVLTRPNSGAGARLGLSMSARIVGNAVRRNLVKRLVRESFRLNQHRLPAVDIVVNGRNAVRNADNNAILRSLERHWQSIACARS